MLEVRDLHVSYGMIDAVKGIDFKVNDSQIVALIGANGAGKTTTMHALSGLLKVKQGEILLDGVDLVKIKPNKIVGMGLIQVPEGRHVFTQMSVEENLMLGSYLRKDKDSIANDFKYIYGLFPRLLERKKQLAGTLSGGEQQMLAIARALMSKPKVLLLDEPSMGLSPLLVKEIFAIIKDVNKRGTTVFVVEQNAKMVLEIADYAYVMETGKIVLEGSGKKLATSPEVQKAYLGG